MKYIKLIKLFIKIPSFIKTLIMVLGAIFIPYYIGYYVPIDYSHIRSNFIFIFKWLLGSLLLFCLSLCYFIFEGLQATNNYFNKLNDKLKEKIEDNRKNKTKIIR